MNTIITFHKYHGLGNDFIVVDARTLDPRPSWPTLARVWCDRHLGIGADGVLVLRCATPASGASVRLLVFNADGSEAEMCGNGLRCVALHVVGANGTVVVQTGAGLTRVVVHDGVTTVDMGAPELDANRVPVRSAETRAIDALLCDVAPDLERVLIDAGVTPRMSCVSMGNPHAVFLCPEPARLRLDVLGPLVERHSLFPRGVNVHFMNVHTRSAAEVRTWERGAGATLACGTGACAAVVAGVLLGVLDREAVIALPGGELRIRWDEATGHVFMTGPARHVYDGTILL